MNPRIPVGYDEVGRWLWNFAVSHGKREHPRAQAKVDAEGDREQRSYGLTLALDGRTAPTMELGFGEVAEGRTRFAWCEALAQRIRSEVRGLASGAGVGRPA
jgi:hypothetical protein